ncbi:hypothetical protein [Chondromyces crocatus]|uniref:Uncharacterized protein n=1 Tax=Chondromyces crocatus TaxID=52 RepID=A0A0K1EQM5_CHOCO|nr:hypothetical protein [Chondromyces crocatus]AKT43109.1 uncharacterized protein CMC5_073370 [Chondromyces crocatus]
MEFDDAGWVTGHITALRIPEAWSLLSPTPEARVDAARWAHVAASFFRMSLAVVQAKAYPSGTLPLVDALEVDLGPREGASTRVQVLTFPIERAPEVRAAALQGVAAIGGAGMDALVARARRVWQVASAVPGQGDARMPLAMAAVLASTFQAPIVPPDEVTIFGVKGARTRLEARGFRT